MSKHQLTVHGRKVFCEDDRAYHGLKYLAYDMDEDTFKDLCNQAEHDREVDFEDDEHRHFTLVDGENLTYTVVTHDKPSGWF